VSTVTPGGNLPGFCLFEPINPIMYYFETEPWHPDLVGDYPAGRVAATVALSRKPRCWVGGREPGAGKITGVRPTSLLFTRRDLDRQST
jgi:hypothetical protein